MDSSAKYWPTALDLRVVLLVAPIPDSLIVGIHLITVQFWKNIFETFKIKSCAFSDFIL